MKLVVGNLKMYMNLEETKEYISVLKGFNNDNVVICPSYIYLHYFLGHNFNLGVQNIFSELNGAYTGEISVLQVKEMGVKYVILGHSERRITLNESNEFINEKVIKSINNGLKVILCIGEHEGCEDKEEFLKSQIDNCLKEVKLDNIIIAYEPVWSIGTGKTPTNEEIKNTIDFIKGYINRNIKVLYGGSVTANNINLLNQIDNVDGFLVGGSSRNAIEFLEIISSVS